ncbi:MAG: NfeD family protein [Acidobacteriota bacterium]|nr:NfeD family protein [Acidobacteriota bacterium]
MIFAATICVCRRFAAIFSAGEIAVFGYMENLAWILWAILGILLIVAEIFTAGFVLFWFGIAALVAAFSALVGFGAGFQFLIFIIVSTILTALSRTIFVKYFSHPQELKSGVDGLPGQIGTVVSPSKGALKSGEVKVYGSVWTAYPAEGEESLNEGDRVEIVRVQGASVYVRKIDDRLPEWRQYAALPSENDQQKY